MVTTRRSGALLAAANAGVASSPLPAPSPAPRRGRSVAQPSSTRKLSKVAEASEEPDTGGMRPSNSIAQAQQALLAQQEQTLQPVSELAVIEMETQAAIDAVPDADQDVVQPVILFPDAAPATPLAQPPSPQAPAQEHQVQPGSPKPATAACAACTPQQVHCETTSTALHDLLATPSGTQVVATSAASNAAAAAAEVKPASAPEPEPAVTSAGPAAETAVPAAAAETAVPAADAETAVPAADAETASGAAAAADAAAAAGAGAAAAEPAAAAGAAAAGVGAAGVGAAGAGAAAGAKAGPAAAAAAEPAAGAAGAAAAGAAAAGAAAGGSLHADDLDHGATSSARSSSSQDDGGSVADDSLSSSSSSSQEDDSSVADDSLSGSGGSDDGSDSSHDDSDSSDDEGAGGRASGSGMLGKLAASIKAALQAKLGQSTRGQPSASLATARSAAAAEQEQDQGAGAGTHRGAAAGTARDLAGAELHWEPAVPLPAAKASQRAALRLSEPGDKEAGLAKKLLAPPRLTAKTCVSQASGSKGLGTAGKAWFDLPAQKIDADTKRELRLLRLRGAFDTKRFYKSFDNTKFPKYFAKGTVVEGPADYYSGRLAAVQRRKATLTEQLLADAELTASRKKRFNRIQEDATQYQKVKKRKTDLPREQKRKPAPKH